VLELRSSAFKHFYWFFYVLSHFIFRETFAEPVVAWDCEAKEEVLLRPYGLLFAGDNPMQAELCSCAGLNTNFFCRTCKAGGTRDWKQSNEGFADVLKVNSILIIGIAALT
jgi:hypothetical protein